jgi:phosphoribosylamine-glycine ligase
MAISDEADKEYHKIGDGLIEKVEYNQKNIDWADFVVFDSNVFNLPYEAEVQRKHGKHVIGSSRFSGLLENDRSFAIQMAKEAGVSVPDVREFSGNSAWNDAKRYLAKFGPSDKLVWKPNGEAPASTFVAESRNEMMQMFPYWQKLFAEHGHEPSFILTDAIEGEEISTEGWFNGTEFYLPNHTLERTRFFDGDHGEKTGCAGNVVWSQSDTPLYHRLFDKLVPIFSGRYNGPVDINVIIEKTSNEPIFLEFTPRFGYDAFFGLMEILDSDMGELFYQTAYGRPITARISRSFSGAVRVHIPPYPEPSAEDDTQRPVGIPIFGLPTESQGRNGTFPVEVMLQGDQFTTTGPDGYVMVVAAKGDSPKSATEAAYRAIEEIRIPTARWRMDLAVKFQDVYNAIKGTGWIDKINRLTSVKHGSFSLFGGSHNG